MRKGTIATMAVLAVAVLLSACGKSEEVGIDEARATFVAECTSAGAGNEEVSAEKLGAYCECMADSSVEMQAYLAEGKTPDDAGLAKMQEATMACLKHLE